MRMDALVKEWMPLLKVAIVFLFLLVVCKILRDVFKFFGKLIIPKPTNMAPTNCNSFLLFAFNFVSLYKLTRKTTFTITSLIMESVLGVCIKMFEKERIFTVFFFNKHSVLLYKPETVQVVLGSSTMVEKSMHYQFVHPWLGKGLFTSSSAKWRQRRKLLAPTFHYSILEEFIPVLQEQSIVLVSKLKALMKEPWVDIAPLANLCTLDIICQTAMGVKINAQTNENNEYVRAVHELTGAITHRALTPWLYPDIIYYRTTEGKKFKSNLQLVHGLTRKVIKEKKAEMLEQNTSKEERETAEDTQLPVKKRKAFLEYLLESHFKDPLLTEEDIREEVDTFMFAGYDTTGVALGWIFYCIGLYPQVQKKVVEELDEIFQGDLEREVTREDLTKMKYLECTIKETLRLYPPAPYQMRECTETVEILGHMIFPGSFFLIFSYALHRDPESFPDPEKFIPERFFPENSKDRHPYAYIPFSAGPRNCIGQKFGMMELKTVTANVLRRFDVTSLDPRDKVVLLPNLTLQSATPLRMRFEMR